MRHLAALLLALPTACQPANQPTTLKENPPEREELTPPYFWSVDDAPFVVAEVGTSGFGGAIVAGFDLDHDGVQEWAGLAFDDNVERSSLRVFEGVEGMFEVGAHPDDQPCEGRLVVGHDIAAGGDTDGDGFGELLVSVGTCAPYIAILRGTGVDDRVRLELPLVDGENTYEVGNSTFVTREGRSWVLVGSRIATPTEAALRWDLVDLQDVPNGATVRLGADTLVGVMEGYSYTAPALDVGQSNLWMANIYDAGIAALCPIEHGIRVAGDCAEIYGSGAGGAGGSATIIDVDQDGVMEVVSGGGEEVAVFDLAGDRLFKISGAWWPETTMASWIGPDGGPWLAISDLVPDGDISRGVLLFRGADLSSIDGQVSRSASDALYRIESEAVPYVSVIRPYQSSPVATPQLLLGTSERVYLLDQPDGEHPTTD